MAQVKLEKEERTKEEKVMTTRREECSTTWPVYWKKGLSFLNGTRSGLFVSSFSPESCCCCCWMQRGVVVVGAGHSFECRRVTRHYFFLPL